MDLSSAEFVAGRVVATFALERLIRARTAFALWTAVVITAILVVGAVVSDGVGAVVIGLVALVAAAITATLWFVRAGVLRALRRVGGGPDYARLRPIVERRMSAVNKSREVITLNPQGALRLAWMARRPAALQDHLRDTAQTVAHTIPEVVADVRAELAAGPQRFNV
ncbi:MAG: hypothetical protein QOK28_199 [Actinomycetota bacterium]